MKKIIFILLVLAAAFSVYWFVFRSDDTPSGPKQQPLEVGKHSAGFNAGIDSLLQYYFVTRDAFVANDSSKIKQAAGELINYCNRMNLDELKKDTSGVFETAVSFLDNIHQTATGMLVDQTFEDLRMDFKSINDNVYPFLKTIHYEGGKLFWQYCNAAFGEDRGGNWLSTTVESDNPYLGRSQANCREVQDTIKAW